MYSGIRSQLAGCALLFASLVACNPAQPWVTSELVPEVRLVSDSPRVRQLIITQAESDSSEVAWLRDFAMPHEERVRGVSQRRRDPKRFAPTLTAFIDRMKAQPGFLVPGHSRCDLLERSGARCIPDRLQLDFYVRVRVSEGPNRGREGWICEGVHLVSTTRGLP